MKNLAAVVTPEAVESTLQDAYDKKLELYPSTKFHVLFKGQGFPPKEIVRYAARKMGIRDLNAYRLNGGRSTNRHLENMGLEIINHKEWQSRASKPKAQVNEVKITRLTFNTNGWVSPSGRERKSKTPGLHEADYGYGHEEWLFDFSKKIRGVQFGFIEGFRTKNNKHGGKTYDLQLFTIDSLGKEKYWVGTIKNCQVLTRQEQISMQREVFKRGWIDEMGGQLEAIENWDKSVEESLNKFGPNVRFAEEDVLLYDKPIPVKHNTYIDSRDRYLLYDWDDAALVSSPSTGFVFTASKPQARKKVWRMNDPEFQSKEIKQLHRDIAFALHQELSIKYGAGNIGCDVPNSFGTSIDMVRKAGNEFIFYEIKTYCQLRKNIRAALGQLLEYAYWDRSKKIKQIVIVSDKPLDTHAMSYLDFLRTEFNLPIDYKHQPISN